MRMLKSCRAAFCTRRADCLVGFLSCLRGLWLEEVSTKPVGFWNFEILPGAIVNDSFAFWGMRHLTNGFERVLEQVFSQCLQNDMSQLRGQMKQRVMLEQTWIMDVG